MGGAQPLAITMNGGIALLVDVDRARLERRRELRYLDRVVDSREEALREVERARSATATPYRSATRAMRPNEFPALYDARAFVPTP